MKTTGLALAACAFAVLAGCGGSAAPGTPGGNSGSSAGSNAGAGSTGSDVATLEQLAAETRSGAVAYGSTMSGPGVTLSSCSSIEGAYDAQVRPWIAQMVGMAGAMDTFMEGHGGAMSADVGCVTTAMQEELDSHASVACSLATLADDEAEAARHAAAMEAYTGHIWDRCNEMTTGLAGDGYSWGSMMDGCGGMMNGGPPPGGPGADAGAADGGSADAGSPDGSLDPLAIGQRIFDQGIGMDGQPIPHTGGMAMMNACASCHGADGHGRQTMMFDSPDITYANLTNPAGMIEPDGTHGMVYTDALIQRAVETGIGADGQPLSDWMPRWQLQDEEFADLLLYLKTLL